MLTFVIATISGNFTAMTSLSEFLLLVLLVLKMATYFHSLQSTILHLQLVFQENVFNGLEHISLGLHRHWWDAEHQEKWPGHEEICGEYAAGPEEIPQSERRAAQSGCQKLQTTNGQNYTQA